MEGSSSVPRLRDLELPPAQVGGSFGLQGEGVPLCSVQVVAALFEPGRKCFERLAKPCMLTSNRSIARGKCRVQTKFATDWARKAEKSNRFLFLGLG